MKKGIHPKLHEVEVELGNEYKFTIMSTYSKSRKLNYTHSPITKDAMNKKSVRTDVLGVQKFQNKYGDLFESHNNKTADGDKEE